MEEGPEVAMTVDRERSQNCIEARGGDMWRGSKGALTVVRDIAEVESSFWMARTRASYNLAEK